MASFRVDDIAKFDGAMGERGTTLSKIAAAQRPASFVRLQSLPPNKALMWSAGRLNSSVLTDVYEELFAVLEKEFKGTMPSSHNLERWLALYDGESAMYLDAPGTELQLAMVSEVEDPQAMRKLFRELPDFGMKIAGLTLVSRE